MRKNMFIPNKAGDLIGFTLIAIRKIKIYICVYLRISCVESLYYN